MIKSGKTMQNVKGIVKLFEFGLKQNNHINTAHSDYVAFTTQTAYSCLGDSAVEPYGCNINHYALHISRDTSNNILTVFKCAQKTNTSDDVFAVISDDLNKCTIYANQRITDGLVRTTIDYADMPSNIKMAQLESDTYTFDESEMILPTYGVIEEWIADLQTATATNADDIKEICDVTTTTISSKNLLDINSVDFLSNKIISVDGREVDNKNNSTTGFMPCDVGDTIIAGAANSDNSALTRRNSAYVVLYDKNKTFLSRSAQYPFVNYVYTISDENAKYFRVIDTNSFFNNTYIMIAKSSTNVNYEAYFETYIQTKNQADVDEIKTTVELNTANINTNTSDIADLRAYVGYTNDDILGLQVDYENKMFTRLAGAVGKNAGADFDSFAMYGGRRRCNVANDGTINAYYGDEGYSDTGSNGQVMVYQPAFYYKVVPLKLDKNTDSGIGYHIRKANYYVSATPHTGFKLHPAFYDEGGNPVDYILYSAYEGSLYSNHHIVSDDNDTETTWDLSADYLCSYANTKPISGLYKPLTKTNAETLAKNLGTGWHIDTIKSVSANQLLMMIELGTMNTQAAIGMGVVSITDNNSYNCSSLTGSTLTLGDSTGMAESTTNRQGDTTATYTENGKVAVSYRGVENPWGNIWKHVNGINIWGDGTMCGGQVYVADDFNFSESKRDGNYKSVGFTLPNSNGYISALGYNSGPYDWLFIPSESNGSSALPTGDFTYVTSALNTYRIVRSCGSWTNVSGAGVYVCYASDGINSKSRNIGVRLLYVPTARR